MSKIALFCSKTNPPHPIIVVLLRKVWSDWSFYSGENGRVSRFNSGDLAGKCADFNSQQKIALRAENNCLSISLSIDYSDLTDYLVRPSISLKGWSDHRRGYHPRYTRPQQPSAEGTKDSCRPYRASLYVGTHHRGLTPPSVISSPLRGYNLVPTIYQSDKSVQSVAL